LENIICHNKAIIAFQKLNMMDLHDNKIIDTDTDGEKTHEKMLNITYHQGNANPNYKEILPHTGQNG